MVPFPFSIQRNDIIAARITMLQTTETLIAGLAANDETRWARFYRDYAPYIENTLRKSTPLSPPDVEDVIHETQVALVALMPACRHDRAGKGAFHSLVLRIAQNKAYDFLRRETRVQNRHAAFAADPAAGPSAAVEPSFTLFVQDRLSPLCHPGRAANEIKKLLKERNVDRSVSRRVAVAAYELEINICIHSHGGILTFILADDTVTIKAKDRGPGIPDIEWACRDGTSTANDWIRSLGFGAGMGLSNSKRVSDEFDIQSEVGRFTKVTSLFRLKHDDSADATKSASKAGGV